MTRIPLAKAQAIADELQLEFLKTCERVRIAGSVRRQKPDCHDVELVVIAKREPLQTDLFGNPLTYRNLFDERCDLLRYDGTLSDRLDKNGRKSWGEKYKRAMYQGVPVDLFSASAENWGLILTLRTGPASFNLKLVQPRTRGGFLPFGFRVNSGQLWKGNDVIPTPWESSLFEAIGIDYLEPEARQ